MLRSIGIMGIAIVLLGMSILAQAQPTDGERQPVATRLRTHMDSEMAVLQTNREELHTKLDTLNQMEPLVTRVVNSARSNNPASVEACAEALVQYSQAISALTHAADAQGMHIERVGYLFELVENKEAEGEIPRGTLTIEDREALEIAAIDLSNVREAIEEAEDTQEIVTDAAAERTGLRIPAVGDSGPVGLRIAAFFLPEGMVNINVPQQGFVFVVNSNPDHAIAGRLTFRLSNPSQMRVSGEQEVTIPPLGARKLNFSITVTAEGAEVGYLPQIEEVSPSR